MRTDKKNLEEVNRHYDNCLEEFGFNARGMGWKNELAQARRFEQMVRIISDDDFSINDLGCGIGDFFAYLLQSGKKEFRYTGYDLRSDMINFSRERYANSNAIFRCVESANELEPADYTIACGIFNLKYSMSDKEWLKHILATVDQMYKSSLRGIAFNMLTKYSDPGRMEDYLFYGDPLLLFDHCKKNLSRNVALLHDYDEYDFTLLVRK